jgi:peptidoglycan/xylan/chitin deacetylase (PgdA/CDA1 family)
MIMRMLFSIRALCLILVLAFASPAEAQFRVLLYHADPNFSFSEAMLVEHMDFLKANDFHTVTLDQFLDWKENNRPMPIRPLVLTFDDNYIRMYHITWPVLTARGFSGVNFAHTHYVGWPDNRRCDWSQIREMEQSGVLLTESHTMKHLNLPTLTEADAREEIKGSKQAIEANIPGKTCRYIAYPYGAYDAKIIELCQEAGYTAAFAVGGGINYHDTPLFELQRIGVDGASLETFKSRIGFNDLPPAPPGPGWTIDNRDVNFFFDPAAWSLVTTHSQRYGRDHRARTPGDGTQPVRWAAYLPRKGLFRVHAWWTASAGSASNAAYRIHDDTGEHVVRVDQRISGGQWNALGLFRFTLDAPADVRLLDEGDGALSADGVWFEPVVNEHSGWIIY